MWWQNKVICLRRSLNSTSSVGDTSGSDGPVEWPERRHYAGFAATKKKNANSQQRLTHWHSRSHRAIHGTLVILKSCQGIGRQSIPILLFSAVAKCDLNSHDMGGFIVLIRL